MVELDADPQIALQQIARVMEDLRRANPEPGMMVGTATPNDTEVIANLIKLFSDGNDIVVASGAGAAAAVPGPSDFILQLYMFDQFYTELDIEGKTFPEDHPGRLLQDIAAYHQAVETAAAAPADAVDTAIPPEIVQRAQRASTDFVTKAWEELQRHAGVHLVPDEQDLAALNPDLVLRRQGHMVMVENMTGALASAPNAAAAKAESFLTVMEGASRYRDKLDQTLQNFVTDQNPDPRANGRALYDRLNARRGAAGAAGRPKVTVLGLGPSGIETVLRAWLEGASVTAVEARGEYTRNNTFRLPEEFVHQLYELFVDDPHDIESLPDEHPLKVLVVRLEAIKGIRLAPDWGPYFDRYYQISIKDYENLTRSIIDTIAVHDPDLTIHQGYVYEPGSCLTADRQVSATLKGGTRRIDIPTDYLVDSTGLRAVTANDAGLNRQDMSTASPYCTYTYHMARPGPASEGAKVDYSTQLTQMDESDPAELRAQGWDRDDKPVSRFFITGDHPYIGVDLPQSLWIYYQEKTQQIKGERDTPRRNALQKELETTLQRWANTTLRAHMTQDAIDRMVLKSIAAFETKLSRIEQPTYTTPSGLRGFFVGDALHTAHFQTGSGALYGIFDGRKFGEFVRDSQNPTIGVEAAADQYATEAEELAYRLHKRAFDFTTGEDLKLRPTPAFIALEQQLHPDEAALRAQRTRAQELRRDFHIRPDGSLIAKTPEGAQQKAAQKAKTGRF